MKKYIAMIKYLFFPFLMSNAAGVDFAKDVLNNIAVTAKVEVGNTIWVGTSQGFYIVNKKNNKIAHFTASNSVLPSDHVTGICVTPDENVYVSTDKGIFRYDGYDYMQITTDNAKLPTDNITSITCDKDGYLWIGTKDKGVVMMFNYKCKTYNSSNSVLTDNSVTKVATDSNDNIIATLGNGDVVKINERGMKLEPKTNADQNQLVAKK